MATRVNAPLDRGQDDEEQRATPGRCSARRRSIGRLAGIGGLALLGWSSVAAGASRDTGGTHSEVRLLAGGGNLAGVEIRLDPGVLTYWRNPGDAGVAPRFDFSRSANLAGARVDYPAPRRLDEAGSEIFGYEGSVVFPLHLTPQDPTRPVTLALDLDYAVCARLCLPAQAHVERTLQGQAPPDEAARVTAALSSVPRTSTLGAPGPLAVDALVRVKGPGGKPGFEVRGQAEASSSALFVEAPEGWYLEAGSARADGPGRVTIPVTVTEKPEAAGASVDLRLTLVDASGAIELPATVTWASGASVAP